MLAMNKNSAVTVTDDEALETASIKKGKAKTEDHTKTVDLSRRDRLRLWIKNSHKNFTALGFLPGIVILLAFGVPAALLVLSAAIVGAIAGGVVAGLALGIGTLIGRFFTKDFKSAFEAVYEGAKYPFYFILGIVAAGPLFVSAVGMLVSFVLSTITTIISKCTLGLLGALMGAMTSPLALITKPGTLWQTVENSMPGLRASTKSESDPQTWALMKLCEVNLSIVMAGASFARSSAIPMKPSRAGIPGTESTREILDGHTHGRVMASLLDDFTKSAVGNNGAPVDANTTAPAADRKGLTDAELGAALAQWHMKIKALEDLASVPPVPSDLTAPTLSGADTSSIHP